MSQVFAWCGQSIGSFSFSFSPFNEHPGLISFGMGWLNLLAVQGTLKSLLQHHSSKASILRRSAFFTVQLSHPYMITGKTIALTRWTFVGKVMSLLFNMLSRLVITFLPRSKCLLISGLQSPSTPKEMTSISPNCVLTPSLLLPPSRVPAFAFRIQVFPNPRAGKVFMSQVQWGNHARWRVPSLNGSLILPPGPTEAIRVDVSSYEAGDWRFDVLGTEEEKSSTWEWEGKFPQDRGGRHLQVETWAREEAAPLTWEAGEGMAGAGAGEAWALAYAAGGSQSQVACCWTGPWDLGQYWAAAAILASSQDQVQVWKISLDEILMLDVPLVLVDEHCSCICFELDTWEELPG